MPKYDTLAALIKTLTPAERRYFKLFSRLQSGEKKYVQIFDLIEKNGAYDTALIAKLLTIPATQLAVHKHYLNTVLLNSLRSNTEQATDTDKVYNAVLDIRLLLKRRLFTQAFEIIKKNVALAWDRELFETLHELLSMKRDCLLNMSAYTETLKMEKEHAKLAGITAQLNEIMHLRTLIFWEDKKREGAAVAKKIMQHKLLKAPPENLLSLRAAVAWFDVTAFSHTLITKEDESLLLARKNQAFIKKHPKLKRINGMAYVVCYTRLSKAEAHAGNITTALNLLTELEDILDTGELNIARIKAMSVKFYIYVSRTIIFQSEGRFEEILQEVEKARPLKDSRSIYEQLSLDFSEAVALVLLKQSHKAVGLIDELIQHKLPVKWLLEKNLRPLLIMAQIDMGNYQLLPYLIKSAKAWMKRRHKNDEEYNLFYTYMGEIYSATSVQARKHVYRKLLNDVETDKIYALADNCSLGYWLQSKIKE